MVTQQNIETLKPVLVNKTVVRTLARFFVEHNAWYWSAGVVVDEDNIDDLYAGDGEQSVPQAVEICFLPSGTPDADATAGYTDRNISADDREDEGDPEDMLIEAIGYTEGDHTPENFKLMKATALARCLDGKRYVQMRSRSRLVYEDEPGLLAWLFPHLDPFGIGGFGELNRTPQQHISFARQLRNLLLQDNSPFQSDPNFAYVCWNITQKRELSRQLAFRIDCDTQYDLGRQLYEIAPGLTDLIRLWERDPRARPLDDQQQRALRILE
ncbi:hypothetical protein HYDPIDRAFT_33933 [Hydnomerulius pinastri MD-312]|uniref:Uncharacterized protein n=1 Tax=Hydnomerulius pinastri MD-312 TaxID=994086 RepID=A0A0C9VM45_9AGAM|nr:hypothetical protein HYDPIDRAFT_33933 [Hydnomerulius pinastri MD-312]